MIDETLQIFSDEAEDLLNAAEQALLNMDDLKNVQEISDGVNDLFRTFHTIKGAAGLLGLDSIVEFTHIVENLLGNVREGQVLVDEEMVSLFLNSRDHLEKLVEIAISGETVLGSDVQANDDSLIAQLNLYLQGPDSKETEATDEDSFCETLAPKGEDSYGGVINTNWHISLRFGINSFCNGMDPASFINYLNKLGSIEHIVLVEDSLPSWSEFDPEQCFLGFEIELSSDVATKDSLEEVFEFIQDDCKISILPPNSKIEDYIKLIQQLPEEDMRIGDMLVACGSLTEREKDDILNTQDSITDEIIGTDDARQVPPLGQVAVAQRVVVQEVVDAAVQKQSQQKKSAQKAQQTIRVNALKLENLVNLVGELVIGTANAELNSEKINDSGLSEAMENLHRLVEEVRDTTLGLRMVQIGETFNRFKRVVREVARDLGKNIELQINGAETELDKTLIEKISDPLMHLVRNAVDHGIELPEERAASDKEPQGIVRLQAYHDSGSVVIQVSDNGKGLSKEKLLNKAIEKGLVESGQNLTDKEVYNLIFHAGLSTADKVSNLSGRGVGMDVVKRNIEALRGQVEIDSREGEGSRISIRLPLTLAIIDGFQVRVGDSQYIMPLDMVDECIELEEALGNTTGDEDTNYINLRGEILPYVQMIDVFGMERVEGLERKDNIVVVQFAGKKAGFVVDELLGEHQTVIKPLGKLFGNVKGISGATILGSGEVAMIVDIPDMIEKVISSGKKLFNTSHVVH